MFSTNSLVIKKSIDVNNAIESNCNFFLVSIKEIESSKIDINYEDKSNSNEQIIDRDSFLERIQH